MNQPSLFEPVDQTIEQTRQMLVRNAVDDRELLVVLVQFELDIAEVTDSPECERIVCRSYHEVYAG